MIYKVHLLPEAEDDLVLLYRYIAFHASPRTARQYLDRIRSFLAGLAHFPERGTVRDEVEPGL
jgi:plasmid stabilization system protein ParE